MRILCKLVETFRVVEWRDGCVYKTQSLGYSWVPMNAAPIDNDILWTPPSTSIPQPWYKYMEAE